MICFLLCMPYHGHKKEVGYAVSLENKILHKLQGKAWCTLFTYMCTHISFLTFMECCVHTDIYIMQCE